jgi:ADP-heptose:LPS heptosyltransferase
MNASLLGSSPAPRRIAVFRALQLGDLLCAVPALRALRQAFPDAHIGLIGLPNAREFVSRFGGYVDELIEFPGVDAFPEQPAREDALPDFHTRVRAMNFDVALQMHGSGDQSNRIVEQLGAKRCGGFVGQAGPGVPGQWMPWPDDLPEPHRYLALLRHLGLTADDDALEFPCSEDDRRDAAALLQEYSLDPSRLVLMHVGARLASRRWPLERYARAATAILLQGWQVALTGTSAERALAADVRRLSGRNLPDLCGKTTLGSLASLVESSRLLLCNDTGISHIAAAMRAPSVVIASGSDARRWAPTNHDLHVVLAGDAPCRPCAYEHCPVGHPCALAVTVPQVLREVNRQLARGRQ